MNIIDCVSLAKDIGSFIIKKFEIEDKLLLKELNTAIENFITESEGTDLDSKVFYDFLVMDTTKNTIFNEVFNSLSLKGNNEINKLVDEASELIQKERYSDLITQNKFYVWSQCLDYFNKLIELIREILVESLSIQEKFKIKMAQPKCIGLNKIDFSSSDIEYELINQKMDTFFSNYFDIKNEQIRNTINFCKELLRNSIEHGNGENFKINITSNNTIQIGEDGCRYNLLDYSNDKNKISGGDSSKNILIYDGYDIEYAYDGQFNWYHIKKINQGEDLIIIDNFCNILINEKSSIYSLYSDLPKEYQKLEINKEEYFSDQLVVPNQCNELSIFVTEKDAVISYIINLIEICQNILMGKKDSIQRIDIIVDGTMDAINCCKRHIQNQGYNINIIKEQKNK